jgi:hypothetical protein
MSSAVMPRFTRGIQYSRDVSVKHDRLWNTGSPAFAGDDTELLFDILNHISAPPRAQSARGEGSQTYLGTYTAGARRTTTGGGSSRCQIRPSSNWMRMPSGE